MGLTRQQRGYAADHDQLRKLWSVRVDRGEVFCARCSVWIPPGGKDHALFAAKTTRAGI